MGVDGKEEEGFELTKDLAGDLFHVQVAAPSYESDDVEVCFLDGALKGITMKVPCYYIRK